MGNRVSSNVAHAFCLAPLEPLPIVDARFCRPTPTSVVLPTLLFATHIDCVLRTVDGSPLLYWDGRRTALLDHPADPTVVAHMERKMHMHINTHDVFLESRILAKHRIMKIQVDFPELYKPKVTSRVETADGDRILFHANGDWSGRNAIITMSREPEEATVVVARIRSDSDKMFDEYIVDVVPGIDVAAVILVCTAIDRIASVLRGLIY
ncbi:hypothetical protein ACHHYP_00947 [Achlya hypogyna]|uniref:Tubby C-terminal domain-containing protein n=1 Tax=Achlya hypogyna TaxID=1202772 RepID=A0A1V9ZA55_ACHHY|nr:hypothetical protein ACHHYP_00947 [Achlya hypogyna]